MIFDAELFLLFVSLRCVGASLLEVDVQNPENVVVGGTATMGCIFNCDIDEIFSVKWYRGYREFYRYMPSEEPVIKVFPFTVGGIEVFEVDVQKSNATHITLRNVSSFLSGQFNCEVTAGKNLATVTAPVNLHVYDPAVLKQPTIKYLINEQKVLCSTVRVHNFTRNYSTVFYSDSDKIDSKYVTYDDYNKVIVLDTRLLEWNNIKSRIIYCEVDLPGATPISSEEILIQNFTGGAISITPSIILISVVINLTILVYNYSI